MARRIVEEVLADEEAGRGTARDLLDAALRGRDLDPREKNLQLGFGSGCFNCGECVDICATVQSHKAQDPLLSFRSGKAR